MDTQDQIFGLIETAQEQQAAVNAALSKLAKVTEDFRTSANAAVSAIEDTTRAQVSSGMMRASERAFEIVAEAVNPLYVSLKEVAVTADEAAKGYRDSASSIHARWIAVAGGMAACCVAAVLIAAWVSMTWQRRQVEGLKEEKATLTAEVADLAATANKLTAKGGKAALTLCIIDAQKSLPCVRVDADRGVYGDKAKGLYYVLHGY